MIVVPITNVERLFDLKLIPMIYMVYRLSYENYNCGGVGVYLCAEIVKSSVLTR